MKYLSKIVNICVKILGFRCVFLEIRAVHLGHTLIESAYANYYRPIYIFFQKPEANQWLCKKLKQNFQRSAFCELLRSKAIKYRQGLNFKDFQNLYNLLNLGFNVFPKSKPTINFSNKEISDCKKFFKKYGLKKKKYVLFCLRDESYYKKIKLDLAPAKSFKFRNPELKNYVEAANETRKMGLIPIRFGFSAQKNPSSAFFDINECTDYRPWIEAFLAKNALFCVGNFTGSTLYCKLFNIPVLWIDIFWRGCVVGNPNDFLAPKHLLMNNKRLSFLNQKNLGAPKDNLFENYGIPGLSVENLNSRTIANCVKEMIYRQLKQIKGTTFRNENSKFVKLHYQKMIKNGIRPTPLLDSWISEFPEVLYESSAVSRPSLYEKFWLGKKEKWDPDRNHSKSLENFYRFLQK